MLFSTIPQEHLVFQEESGIATWMTWLN